MAKKRKIIPYRNLDIHKEIKTLEMAIQWDLLLLLLLLLLLVFSYLYRTTVSGVLREYPQA